MPEAHILFHSSNYAMWAEETLKETGVNCKLVSVPRHMSSDCGYCVRVSEDDLAGALHILDRENIEYDRGVSQGNG